MHDIVHLLKTKYMTKIRNTCQQLDRYLSTVG